MTPLDDLSPDQRAVLQLLLKQGKRYEELAALLRIEPGAVRQRAVSALDALGPETQLVAGRRAELTDWLLGQQDPAESERTVEYVESAPAAQAWAASVAAALREGGLGGDRLPDVAVAQEPIVEPESEPLDEPDDEPGPDDGPEPAPAPEPREPAAERMPGFGPAPAGDASRAPASKLGGALLLAGLVIVLAVALVWVLSRDDDDGGSDTPTVAQTQTTATTPTTDASDEDAQIIGQVNLTAPGGGKAIGVANVLAQGEQRAIAIQAEKLEPNTRRDAYAVWLTGGDGGEVTRLGFAPAVGRNGRLEGAASLPADARDYSRLVLSLEDQSDPQEPGDVALSGRLRLG